MSLTSSDVEQLKQQLASRADEIDLLNAFLSADIESCSPFLYVHGYKSVGKTTTVVQFLKALGAKYSIVDCDKILSQKLLLQASVKCIRKDSKADLEKSKQFYNRGTFDSKLKGCDTFTNFTFNLEKFISEVPYNEQHFLILDNMDQLQDDANTIITNFARMRDVSPIKNIFIIIISRLEPPNQLVTTGCPQIYFRPYSTYEVINILNSKLIAQEESTKSPSTQFQISFIQLTVELFYDYCGGNITILEDICTENFAELLYRLETSVLESTDFVKVYRNNRDLFQLDRILDCKVLDYRSKTFETSGTTLSLSDISYVSKFILIAAYLASHIDYRYDLYCFTSTKFPKFRPTSRRQGGQISKKDIDYKLLQPNFFDLERLHAILLVIYRNESKSFEDHGSDPTYNTLSEAQLALKQHEINQFSLVGNMDIHGQLSGLLAQGLITRHASRDVLQPKTRWRSNLGWDEIEAIAKDIEFPLENYLS